MDHNIADDYQELKDIEGEDLDDFIVDVQKSFKIKYNSDDFSHVYTYGEFCDVIIGKFESFDTDTDCSTQQAFYRLRAAISDTLGINKSEIKVQTGMDQLFERQNRIRNIKALKKLLGVDVKFLGPPLWYSLLCTALLLLSLIMFFFSWKIASTGIFASILMFKIGDWFGKEFESITVGDFAKQMVRKHYRESRKKQHSVNRIEMRRLLDEMIADKFCLDKASLTKDAKFAWAK